jgi:PAS domain S-box-containing protein
MVYWLMATGGLPREGSVALESHLLDRVQAAVFVTDLAGVVVFANPYCEVLYGVGPHEIVGRRARDLAPEAITAEVLTQIANEITQGRNWEGEFRVLRRDGTSVDVHEIDSPFFDDAGNVSGVVSLAIDVSAQRLSQEELMRVLTVAQILRDIGATLVAELDADQVMKTVTAAARKLTGGTSAAFLRVDPEEGEGLLFVRAGSGRARQSSLGVAVPIDSLLFADAIASETAIRIDDAAKDDELVRILDDVMPAMRTPLRSFVVMAVRTRSGDVAGAMIVAHNEPNRFTATEEQLLSDIAAQAGIVLDIARLFRAAEVEIAARRRAEEIQRFYAETSAVLSSSLDYPESFERVGRLCVPFLADLCLIDVADEHGVRRLAAVHADPDKEPLVAELVTGYAPARLGRHPAARVLRGEPPEFGETISDSFLRATTRDDWHYQLVKQLDVTSYMCVPLEARGRVLGALTLVSSGSGRRFGASDLALAEEFARRAGLALDNARLYSERDHVARALQSSLLPPTLPAIAGARVTARYQAAGEGNEVGGDFYHVFQVDEDAWWFIIGDVSGKGPEAAAIAGLARHTLRALAIQERSPRRLLTSLHETLLRGEANGEFCTVCCALLQTTERGAKLSIACGGHPPPIIRRADGAVEAANCAGPLLGMPVELAFVEQAVELGPGDMVVMYTDGVTEAHHRNQPLFGEERLIDVIRAGADVDLVADGILAAVSAYGPAEPRDDVAVVVVQIDA